MLTDISKAIDQMNFDDSTKKIFSDNIDSLIDKASTKKQAMDILEQVSNSTDVSNSDQANFRKLLNIINGVEEQRNATTTETKEEKKVRQESQETQAKQEEKKIQDAEDKADIKSKETQSKDKFNFSVTSKNKEVSYKVTPHISKDKNGNTIVTYSSNLTYVKGAPKGHSEGEKRTLEDGKGFVGLDFGDIDFAEYAARHRREEGILITREEVDKEDIEESKETITNLLTDLLSNKLNTNIL